VRYVDGKVVDSDSCHAPITDRRGEWIGIGFGARGPAAWWFVSATSPALASMRDVPPAMSANLYQLAPQVDGYHAIRPSGPPPVPSPFERFDGRGTFLGSNDAWHATGIHALPQGGSVLVTVDASSVQRVVWVGAAGEERAAAVMPDPVAALAVSSTGSVLVLGSTGLARWYDANGAPTTDWFADGFGSAGFPALSTALADGSVVVGRAHRYEPGTTRVSPLPDWLVARPASLPAMLDGVGALGVVRGGAANALATVKLGGSQPCEIEIEILTPAGESCGTVRLTAPERCWGVTLGPDGTVLASGDVVQAAADGTSKYLCSWRWWSGLLR
jgi:hypothetical protein